MAIRIVRLGTERLPGEGLRIGTVRRPPRGVPKAEYSTRNFYDVWLPTLAPGAETIKLGQSAKTAKDWERFIGRYRAEMARPENRATLDLLAQPFAIGVGFAVLACYRLTAPRSRNRL